MKLSFNLTEFVKNTLNLTDYVDVHAASDNIRKNVPFRGPNVYILFVAIIIASVGLNVNSIPVIIGAMLISPLMGPIIGLGLGLGTNDRELVLFSIKNLLVMVGISLLAATLYFILTPLEIDNPTELLARTRPTIYDVFIALFGGLASLVDSGQGTLNWSAFCVTSRVDFGCFGRKYYSRNATKSRNFENVISR